MAIILEICSLDKLSLIKRLELDQALITFGRSKSCHIELDYPEVSRRHFLIKYVDQGYFLFDENSKNGTILDGHRVEPHQAYPLQNEHEVTLKNVQIKILWDGQSPKLERTTEVAQKLLDDFLHEGPREIAPFLSSKDASYRFNFAHEKSSFVLGSSPDADFVVNGHQIHLKHVSFARDLYGIRIIPLPLNEVVLNQVVINEPTILSHKSVVRLGSLELCFYDREVEDPPVKEELNTPETLEIAKELPQANIKSSPKTLLKILDGIFFTAFMLVIVGISILLWQTI